MKNGFKNDHGKLLRYLDYIRALSFVDDISVFPYTSQVGSTIMSNMLLLIHEKMSDMLPSMFPVHLNEIEDDSIEMDEYDYLCSDIENSEITNVPTFMIHLFKIGDIEAYSLYNNAIKQIFPRIGSRMFGLGTPEADYWDEFSIIKYPSRKQLCKMLGSKEYQEGFTSFVKAVTDSRVYCTTQII